MAQVEKINSRVITCTEEEFQFIMDGLWNKLEELKKRVSEAEALEEGVKQKRYDTMMKCKSLFYDLTGHH